MSILEYQFALLKGNDIIWNEIISTWKIKKNNEINIILLTIENVYVVLKIVWHDSKVWTFFFLSFLFILYIYIEEMERLVWLFRTKIKGQTGGK